MEEEKVKEAIDIIVTACEKHESNYELAAQYIKKEVETKFGPVWNAVVGEAFSYQVDYQAGNALILFPAGKLACLLWKTPNQD